MISLVAYFLCLLALWGGVFADRDHLLVEDSHSSDNPTVKPTVTKGLIIDGGSGGSRLHVYTWKPRAFNTVPPPLSFPEANEKWTGRVDPGIHNYADNLPGIASHLAQLIDFAKLALVGYEREFGDYPIYFKATGGMRELSQPKREAMIAYVRQLLSDKSFCPFFFRDDFARVISGEEEAIFSWAATNFLMGTLLPNSQGLGVVADVNTTFGTLDLGGASTQIAFYVPSQDILEGLTKLQLGGQKQWNVYTKSFLQFGINSARTRHTNSVVDRHVAQLGNQASPITRYTIVNPCFFAGYSEDGEDSRGIYSADIIGPTTASVDQLAKCRASLKPLMERELGTFCDKVYHGDCSIAGAYQPPVPTGRHGHFIGTSSYKYPWAFLQLPKTATLQQFEDAARDICARSFGEINYYFVSHNLNANTNDKLSDYLPYYCFLSAYMLTLLEDGYRFNKTQTLTVMDEVNGHKVGWALGAILYEINELPWELQLSVVERNPLGFVFFAGVIGFFLGVVAAILVYREILEDRSFFSPSAFLPISSTAPSRNSGSFVGGGSSRPGSVHSSAERFDTLSRQNTLDIIKRKLSSSTEDDSPPQTRYSYNSLLSSNTNSGGANGRRSNASAAGGTNGRSMTSSIQMADQHYRGLKIKSPYDDQGMYRPEDLGNSGAKRSNTLNDDVVNNDVHRNTPHTPNTSGNHSSSAPNVYNAPKSLVQRLVSSSDSGLGSQSLSHSHSANGSQWFSWGVRTNAASAGLVPTATVSTPLNARSHRGDSNASNNSSHSSNSSHDSRSDRAGMGRHNYAAIGGDDLDK